VHRKGLVGKKRAFLETLTIAAPGLANAWRAGQPMQFNQKQGQGSGFGFGRSHVRPQHGSLLMTWCRLLLIFVVSAVSAVPASAGIILRKRGKTDPQKSAKPDPAARLPALIGTLRTDPEEKKRERAAEELRHFDPNAYPEIVAVLIDALQHDPADGVRLEAVQSLAKLRPVSQQVGWALEQAVEHDRSRRVRLQARSALVQYRLSGYHGTKNQEPKLDGVKTEEPPLAGPLVEPPPLPPGPPTVAPAGPEPGRLVPRPQSAPTPAGKSSVARPLPPGPVRPPDGPVQEPPAAPKDNGPELSPPKQ
jgi:hypothetical protein